MSWTTIRHSGVPENTHSAATTTARRIGEKPYDPLDPGPYGTPGWRPDPRRGRHRRAELPDPPPVERRDDPRPDRRRGEQPGRSRSGSLDPHPIERRNEPRPVERRSEPSGISEFESPDRSEPSHARPEPAEPYDFPPMREAAYRDFLRDSEELHQAHFAAPQRNRVLVHLRLYFQIVVAILLRRMLPFTEPPSRTPRSRAACAVRQATRHVGRATVNPRSEVAAIAAAPLGARPLGPVGQVGQVGPQPILAPTAAPLPITVEWRTVESRTVGGNTVEGAALERGTDEGGTFERRIAEEHTAETSQARPAPARRADPPHPHPRPSVRTHSVMAPRNHALSRRRADTRRVFVHTYGLTRDQNLRNLTWPRGSWEGFIASDAYANPRRNAIRRRRNHRPRSLALARSFPSTIPVLPIGATSRPAPIAATARLVPAAATSWPGGDFR